MPTPDFNPVSLRPGAEVAGWRVLRPWRQDGFSITWVVERGGERRLLRMALRRPGSPGGLERERFLEREAGVLRRVRHPGILRLFEEGRWPEPVHGFRYLLLEYVEGVDLLGIQRRDTTARDVLVIFSRIAEALEALHREQITHGSIRVENILLRKPDNAPVLVDFTRADWPGNPFPPPWEDPPRGPEGLGELVGLFQPAIPGKRFTH
jgi:serine/threonine-protein kinase